MSFSSRIFSAFWISEDQILVLLSKDWLFPNQHPPIDFCEKRLADTDFKPTPLLFFAKLSGYYKSVDKITFVYCPKKEDDKKQIYLAGNFNGWKDAIGIEKWLLQPQIINNEAVIALTVPWHEIENLDAQLLFRFVTGDHEWITIPPETPNLTVDHHNNSNYAIYNDFTGRNAFIIKPHINYDPSLTYSVSWKENNEDEIQIIKDDALLSTLGSSKKLGVIINSKGTTFRLFAPRAKFVKVFFYKKGSPELIREIELKRNKDYTWETRYSENLQGYRYFYNVSNNVVILDPYALACEGPGGPGIIIDKRAIPKVKTTFKTPKWNNLIILEAHLRDLIEGTHFVDKVEKPSGFQNFIQWLEINPNYITDLGVNALELLPVQEYERGNPFEYHWGYMPTNYFCPASIYAFGENDMSQIIDFQEVVKTLHRKNISIILDVVYNHSGNPNHLMNIDRDYYFTLDQAGNLTNWSGCGNDFNANTPMGKRLIIESLIYFIKTYNVDGFRFDLAELLGVDVLKEIESALKAVKPSIILIAEPWSFRGHIGHALNETGFASWNDGYREFIADYVRGGSSQEAFVYFIAGSLSDLARFTTQSVNYAASHDDYCWIDKITENPHHNGSHPTTNDIRRTHLMLAILMMSIGIPMLAEGQDFLHSKQGHQNTYQNDYLNTLHYVNLSRYSSTHEYFSKWIDFRLSKIGECIRLTQLPSERYFKFYKHPESTMIGVLYNADLSLEKVAQLLFVINPHLDQKVLPIDLKSEDFVQIADQERFEAKGIQGAQIPWNENHIILPGLSCGLWIKV